MTVVLLKSGDNIYTIRFSVFFKDACQPCSCQQDGGRRKRNTNIKETEAELHLWLILVLQCYLLILRLGPSLGSENRKMT